MDNNNWKELRQKYFKVCTQKDSVDGTKFRIDIAPHDLFEWFKKNLAALQPSTLPLKNDSDCKSIWHNHHVRMSHFCTLCGGATLIEKYEPSTLPLIESDAVEFANWLVSEMKVEPVGGMWEVHGIEHVFEDGKTAVCPVWSTKHLYELFKNSKQ